MKKFIIPVALIILFLIPVTAFSKPSEEEAVKAFKISFQVYFHTALLSAFGQVPEGATVSEELMTFEKVDISVFEIDDSGLYKTLSGKIFLKNQNNIKAVLKLSGGAVKNLEWKIDNFDIKQDNKVLINADGRTLEYNTSNM